MFDIKDGRSQPSLGRRTKFSFLLYFISFFSPTTAQAEKTTPQFIIPIVIDQGAFHYWTRFKPYFQHGFKRFDDNGIVFTNAHHPHAAPVTATGHATLSTGSIAAKHGIIMNAWYNADGKLISSVEDPRDKARVLPAKGSCSCRASSKAIMVPSISDIAVDASTENINYHAYGISYKDRAAIGMAGHKGKAIWFDEHQQAFTSNHDYFETLPTWIDTFNKSLPGKIEQARTWKLFFEPHHEVYSNYAKEIYHLSSVPETIAGTKLGSVGDWKKITSKKNFMLTPQSNNILFDLALTAMNEITQSGSPEDRALIWVSLSSLDKVGHMYGPHSIENIDTLMHLDKIIGDFMTTVETRYGKDKALFIVTADHGVSPIPEAMIEENYRPAKRIIMHKVVDKLNAIIKKKFGIKKLFFGFKTNQLFWNEKKLADVDDDELKEIVQCTKQQLYTLEGVKKVWTFDELNNANPAHNSLVSLFKNQIYAGRSGAFFLLGNPFVMLSNYDKGSCHRSPYNHDTQVPLMFLHAETFKPCKVRNKVFTTQLAPSIAKMWDLPPHKDMNESTLW